MILSLPSRMGDSLDWNLSQASLENSLFWRLDLGLEDPFFPLDDEMPFKAISLALSQFKNTVYPQFQEQTKGVILYQGSADFSLHFAWSDQQKENFLQSNQTDKALFCLDAFLHYFQMLSYHLPDEVPIYLCLDVGHIPSLSRRHQLLSKERFEHFQVAARNLPGFNGWNWTQKGIEGSEKSCEAICLPLNAHLTPKILDQLDLLMASFSRPFRVISEAFLTEEWDGVEVLHVLQGSVSSWGERKLKGFLAAGGEIQFHGR